MMFYRATRRPDHEGREILRRLHGDLRTRRPARQAARAADRQRHPAVGGQRIRAARTTACSPSPGLPTTASFAVVVVNASDADRVTSSGDHRIQLPANLKTAGKVLRPVLTIGQDKSPPTASVRRRRPPAPARPGIQPRGLRRHSGPLTGVRNLFRTNHFNLTAPGCPQAVRSSRFTVLFRKQPDDELRSAVISFSRAARSTLLETIHAPAHAGSRVFSTAGPVIRYSGSVILGS